MQIHRSITTPDTLPFFGMRRAVRTLFSPAERRRPWLLYLTPGLLLAIALEQAWAIVLTPLFTKLVNGYARDVFLFFGMTTRTLARHSLVLLTATICGPLEVIKVRLAIQHYEPLVVLPAEQHDGSIAGDITGTVDNSETGPKRVVKYVNLFR